MNNKTKIGLVLAGLALSFSAGYFATPNKVVTKTLTKTETVKVEGKTRIVYRDRVISPDGTITEKEVEREDTNTREESKSTASSEKSVTKDVGLVISALAIVDVKDVKGEREYGVVVSKRVLGALNVTGFASTEKTVGVGLGWSF